MSTTNIRRHALLEALVELNMVLWYSRMRPRQTYFLLVALVVGPGRLVGLAAGVSSSVVLPAEK